MRHSKKSVQDDRNIAFPPVSGRIIQRALIAAIAIASADLLARLWMESQGYLDEDAAIFFAVGRGILNGLTPYADLFESKPPGVFLLSAGALMLGSTRFANLATMAALLIIPGAIVAPAERQLRDLPADRRYPLFLFIILAALLLALFTAAFSGGFQVEALGAAATAAYLAFVALGSERWHWQRALVASVPLGLSIFLKEPFVLSALAGAMLLAPHPRALRTVFFLPLLFAALFEGTFLLLTGWLMPYLRYLSFMVGHHTDLYNGPLPLRALYLFRSAKNAWLFSPFFCGFLAFLIGCVLWLTWKKERARLRIGVIALALYLTFLAVGAGGEFYAHHFVFAVPVYGALTLAVLRHMARDENITRRWPVTALTVLLIGSSFWHLRQWPARAVRESREKVNDLKSAAAVIDGVLDGCGVDRYLYLVHKGAGPFGYTRHSPLGPVFTSHNRFIFDSDSPLADPFRATLSEAVVMVAKNKEQSGMTDEAWAYLQERFTDVPPPCADLEEQPAPYTISFRKTAIR